MMFQKDIETMNRKEIETLQLERLKYIVDYCYNNVPFYHERLTKAGYVPGKIKCLSDIEYIPYTTKEDMRECYPYGLLATSKKNAVRVHASSGTTGKPTLGFYTKNDLEAWSDCVARVAVGGGVTDEDIIQVSFGYGLFTGALGLHYGLEKVGATVIPASSGNTQKQLMLMRDLGVTGLVATPSYALYLGEALKEAGFSRNEYNLKLGILGSEACTPEMRAQIEESLGIFVSDNYGMTELGGPGVSGECMFRCGLHFAEDHFLPEIIDRDTNARLGEGEFGELVVTTLTKEAMPVLRYRTKDITKLDYSPCECGRTHVRMAKPVGRTDDMIIVKGVNVFPTQVESVIVGMDNIGPHYQLVVRKGSNLLDTLEVKVELTNADLLAHFSMLEKLQRDIKEKLRSVLGLDVKVTLVEPKTLERFQGKAKRVLDLRKEQE